MPAVIPGRGRALVRRVAIASALTLRAAPGTLALCVLLTLTSGALPVVVAWLTKLVLDGLTGGAAPARLLAIALGFVAVGAVAGTSPQVTQYLRVDLDRRVGLLAMDRLFTAVDGFRGLGRFENPHFLDRLRFAQQTGGAMPPCTRAVDAGIGIGRALITIAGFVGSLTLLSPVMAVLVLASGAPALIAEIMLARRRARVFWEVGPAERRELFYSDLLSSVAAAKEVRLFGIGAFLRRRMLFERRSANAAKRAVDRREVIVQAGLGLIAALVSGGGLVWAVRAAEAGTLSVGGITMFVAAVAGVQGALGSLAHETATAHQALLMFDHYVDVTTAGPDLPVAAEPRPLPPIRDGIEFRDVWFRYSADHPWILRGVNLKIPYGKTLAIVGLNGAGKSTLVKLLCRFYDPTLGSIRWDGVDLGDVDVTELRGRIGAVFQDYMNYDMTAAENIALGDLGALHDRARIESAARRAGIHGGLADLPRGYDTLLSRTFFMESAAGDPEAGVLLSGGQWQRVALARAFLCDRRDLMILDEPSAGLDARAEYEIHSALLQHRRGRTSVLISHRLAAVRETDLIVVLRDGRIVEQGDHTSLMALGGAGEYASLFTTQASGYR